jgi:hypothetical protein
VEVMLGCWLAISPFVFRHPASEWKPWANDLACACAVVAFALLSYWPPLKHAHLATGVVALWLIGYGYFAAPHPLPPAMQNELLTGLLLALFAIIPNEANQPPQMWREFYASAEHSQAGEAHRT